MASERVKSWLAMPFPGSAHVAAGPLNPPTPGAGVRGVVEGDVLKALRAKGISPGGEATCAKLEKFWLFLVVL